MSGQGTPELKGSLREGVIPAVLRSLYVGRKTGVLHVTRGSERGSIVFLFGAIAHGDTSIQEVHMGETMVRHGLLGQPDLDRATETVRRTGQRLGMALLQMGIIDEARLEEALALHVREILLRIFSWTEGAYAFEERPRESFKGYDRPLKLSTGEMILEAVRMVRDPEVVRYALGDIDRVLALSTDPLLRFQHITLTPIDGYILSRVDGSLTAREILKITPVLEEPAQRSLLGLLCTGVVEYLPLPAAEAPSARTLRQEVLEASEDLTSRDHFEVLGLTPEATEEDVKAAFFRLARRFHPDVQHDPALADLRERLQALFDRIGRAYKVLGDPQSRAEYECGLLVSRLGPAAEAEASAAASPQAAPAPADPAHEAHRVREGLAAAEASFKEGKYWDAIQAVQEVLGASRGRQRQQARMLLARCYLKNPRWTKLAEEELVAAIGEDGESAEAQFLLGTVYKEGGLNARAAAMFRKVLELKPRHAEARAELDSLQAEPPARPGLLRKLFR